MTPEAQQEAEADQAWVTHLNALDAQGTRRGAALWCVIPGAAFAMFAGALQSPTPKRKR
jgi:hypothetical protein